MTDFEWIPSWTPTEDFSGGNWWETEATGAVMIKPTSESVYPLKIKSPANPSARSSAYAYFSVGVEGANADAFEVGAWDDENDYVITWGRFEVRPVIGSSHFKVDLDGSVTISPSSSAVTPLSILAVAGGDEAFQVTRGPATGGMFVYSDYGIEVNAPEGGDPLTSTDRFSVGWHGWAFRVSQDATHDLIGFFNATPVQKPTGVAVSAAGIHAALVSLGLIAA
jgi:hypothetical protein